LIVVSKAEIGVVELAGTLPAPGALLGTVFDASRRGTIAPRTAKQALPIRRTVEILIGRCNTRQCRNN
jgi:hypothetical protein